MKRSRKPTFVIKKRSKEKESFTNILFFHSTAAEDKLRALKTIHELCHPTLESYLQKLKANHFQKVSNLSKKDAEEYESYEWAILETAYNPKAQDQYFTGKKLGTILGEEAEMYTHREFVRRAFSEMILVYLIIIFEEYVTNVLTILFRKKPEILSTSEKKISFEEVFSYRNSNISDLMNSLIKKEVEARIGLDIDKLGTFLLEKTTLDLKRRPDWKKFKEYFYRRNIVVHNYGFPDSKYIKQTGYNGPIDWLEVNKHYLLEGFDIFGKYISELTSFLSGKFSTL